MIFLNKLAIISLALLSSHTINAQEKHLKNLKQLTYGGDNAEAYFSPDGKFVSFQSNFKKWDVKCDQIFAMDIEKAMLDTNYIPKMVSNGAGRTTCSYYMPDGKEILYASTMMGGQECPQETQIAGKYLWSIHSTYDIYVTSKVGSTKKALVESPGYDAEATVSPLGDKIVFTSDRSGDLELWTMDIDGKNQKQITKDLGYDGGAFFSPDGTKLVFRASRPKNTEEQKEYKRFLSQGLVAPSEMEIFVCNVDGSSLKQITKLGKANWAPFFHPSGKKIIFSSNHKSQKGFDFQLYMINLDGTGLEQITTESVFNAFPMFSPDGKKLIFSSNRNNKGTRDTNLFIADWED